MMIESGTSRLLSVVAIAIALGACGKRESEPVSGAEVVARVNDKPIPQYRVDAAVKSRMAQGQPDTPQTRDGIREAIINQEIVAQEALKQGLDKQPDTAARLELDRQSVLVNAFFEDYFRKNPVSDDMLRKEYERVKAGAPGREYKVRHILVKDEAQAASIIAQLNKGADFTQLAAQNSIDPGSKSRGGDLDWGPAERYVKPFADALAQLPKGKVTETPVKTQFGFHVIRVDDVRSTKFPPYEAVQGQVKQEVQAQIVQKVISDLRAKAKIEETPKPAAKASAGGASGPAQPGGPGK